MTNTSLALLIWLGMLALAIPYVQKIKHHDQRFVAAYLIFVAIFSAATFGLYMAFITLGAAVYGPSLIASPVAVAVAMAAFALIAVWLATLIASKPPMRPPPI